VGHLLSYLGGGWGRGGVSVEVGRGEEEGEEEEVGNTPDSQILEDDRKGGVG